MRAPVMARDCRIGSSRRQVRAILVGSVVFMRHGARTPKERFISADSTISDPEKPTLEDGIASVSSGSGVGVTRVNNSCAAAASKSSLWPFKGTPGALTEQGWRQALNVGMSLQRSFNVVWRCSLCVERVARGGREVASRAVQSEATVPSARTLHHLRHESCRKDDQFAFRAYGNSERDDETEQSPLCWSSNMPVVVCSTESMRCVQTAQGVLKGLVLGNDLTRAELFPDVDERHMVSVATSVGRVGGCCPTARSQDSGKTCITCSQQHLQLPSECLYTAPSGSPVSFALKTKSPLVKLLKQRALRESSRYREACRELGAEAQLLRELTGWRDKQGLKVMKKFVSIYGAYIFHGFPLPSIGHGQDDIGLLNGGNRPPTPSACCERMCNESRANEGVTGTTCGCNTPESIKRGCKGRTITPEKLLEAVFYGADIVARLQYAEDEEVGWRAGGSTLIEIAARLEKMADFRVLRGYKAGGMTNSLSDTHGSSAHREFGASLPLGDGHNDDAFVEGLCVFVSHQSALLALQAALGIAADHIHVPQFGCFLQAELIELEDTNSLKSCDAACDLITPDGYVCHSSEKPGAAEMRDVLRTPPGASSFGHSGDSLLSEEGTRSCSSIRAVGSCEHIQVPPLHSSRFSQVKRSEVADSTAFRQCALDTAAPYAEFPASVNGFGGAECISVSLPISTKQLLSPSVPRPKGQRQKHPNFVIRWTIDGTVPLVLPESLRWSGTQTQDVVICECPSPLNESVPEGLAESGFSNDSLHSAVATTRVSSWIQGSVPSRVETCLSAECRGLSGTMCSHCLHRRRDCKKGTCQSVVEPASGGERAVESVQEPEGCNLVLLDDLLEFIDSRRGRFGSPIPSGVVFQQLMNELSRTESEDIEACMQREQAGCDVLTLDPLGGASRG